MSTPTDDPLLSQSLEAYQTITIDDTTIVISVLDNLNIGKNQVIGDDYSDDSMAIFAEDLILADSFKMKKGIISASSFTASGEGLIDVSGKDGTSPNGVNEDTTKQGQPGGQGDPGGDLSLYFESADIGTGNFKIEANGGDGGAGQFGIDSATGTDGGMGGNGGDGGNVEIVIGLPYLQWLTQLKNIYQLSSLVSQKEALKDTLGSILQDSRLDGLHGLLNAASSASTEDGFKNFIEQAGLVVDGLVDDFTSKLYPCIDTSVGEYGAGGNGKSKPINGKPGTKNGTCQIISFGVPTELNEKNLTSFVIHPSQCARLLDKIKLMYWTLDPVNNPQGVTDIMTLLLRLQNRTQLFVDAKDDSTLVKFYNENESSYGTVRSVNQLRSINGETTNYLALLQHGKDIFGHDSSYVPLGSFQFYKGLLDQLIDNFNVIESSYLTYFVSLQEQEKAIKQIKAARDNLQKVFDNAKSQNETLKDMALETAYLIDSYQIILPPLKNDLDNKLKQFKEQTGSLFNVDLNQVLDSLTTLAFAPDSSFMMLTQASKFLYTGITNVTNDQDIQVRKEYLINEIKSVQSDLNSIEEGYQALDNGMLAPDDPGAGKLVAEEQQIMDFFKGFYDKFPPALDELKKTFEAYILKILERNNQILTYNATVILMFKNQQMINTSLQRTKELNDTALSSMVPDLPDLVTFISNVYYVARAQIMEILDLTARAFRFWALSDTNLIVEAYGNKTLPQISYSALINAQNIILGQYQQAIENFGTNHESFPQSPEQQGIIFEVPQIQVETFKTTKQLMVKIPTVTADISRNDSIFAGMANVRVLLVRVWIDGIKTLNNQLQIKITHSGKEQITNQKNVVFSFSHEPVTKLFIISNLATKKIQEEANFGAENLSNTYATLSPFTTWSINVDPDKNLGLDLKDITRIQIEFHGTNYAII